MRWHRRPLTRQEYHDKMMRRILRGEAIHVPSAEGRTYISAEDGRQLAEKLRAVWLATAEPPAEAGGS